MRFILNASKLAAANTELIGWLTKYISLANLSHIFSFEEADMNSTGKKRPPVDVEQWLDFIIGAQAHRSRNEGQRKFGDLLINRYFKSLCEDYKSDATAKLYLDNMLCAVASAMRQMSIYRDIFGTDWETLREAKEREQARAEQIVEFAPFKKNGFWKPAVATVAALGLSSPILAGFQKTIGNLPWILVAAISLLVILALFIMELFVDWLHNRRLDKVQKRFPADLYKSWQEKELNGWKSVLGKFMLLAENIQNEFYPELKASGPGKNMGEIVDRHIAFTLDFHVAR